MVQDMLEPEYFATASASIDQHLAERTPLVISPLPMTSPWFRTLLGGDEERDFKRLRLSTSGEAQEDDETWWNASTMQSDPNTAMFLAKLYYDQYATEEKLKLNEIVELIGVLELPDAAEENGDDTNQNADPNPWQDEVAVPSDMARLHVMWFRPTSMDTLVGDHVASLPSSTEGEPTTALASALGVSPAVASALAMALLSKAERTQESDVWVPIQTPFSTTLGCLSLSMVLPNDEACVKFQSRLVHVLSQVLPQVHSVDITQESLSSKGLRLPSKVNGRLLPSVLQLPKGSTLILRLGLHNGTRLSSEQVEILQALQQLTSSHSLGYRFDGGVQIPFEADTRIIVLTTAETGNKLLPCSLQISCPLDETMNDNESDLTAVRHMLARARSPQQGHANIHLSRDVLEQAQQDFVARRAAARDTQTAPVEENDFHRWLTLTRLQARSRLAQEATVEDWMKALALDDAVRAAT